MPVERQMGGVQSDAATHEPRRATVGWADERCQATPEQPVMNEQEIRPASDREVDGGFARVHRGRDTGDPTAVLDLKAVQGVGRVSNGRGGEVLVEKPDDVRERDSGARSWSHYRDIN